MLELSEKDWNNPGTKKTCKIESNQMSRFFAQQQEKQRNKQTRAEPVHRREKAFDTRTSDWELNITE